MKTTTIFGSWWGGNLGDTAILKATIQALYEARDTTGEILVHSSNPDLLSNYLVEFDAVEIMRVQNNYWGRETPKSILKSDEVIVGGGGLFFPGDVYNPYKSHLLNLAPISCLARTLRRERHVLTVGANHMDGFVPGILASAVLNGAATISARDQESVDRLSQYTDDPIEYVPDPVFSLEGSMTETVAERTKEIPSETVVLSIHDDLTRHSPAVDLNGCAKTIVKQVNRYAKENGYDVLLYNNYVFSDWIDGFAEEFDSEVTVHSIEADGLQPEEVVSILSQFEVAVCSQMHANIFCLLAGTPNVAIEYDHKVRSMMKLVNRGSHVLGLGELDDELVQLMDKCAPVDEERVDKLGNAFHAHVAKL